MFGATKNSDRSNSNRNKYVYSGCGIAFDRAGAWSFGNDFAEIVVAVAIVNNSSSHTDNHNNTFLVLGERPTYEINRNFGSAEKEFSINFNKAKIKFCLSLYYNADNSYLFVNGNETYNFKANNKLALFLINFV